MFGPESLLLLPTDSEALQLSAFVRIPLGTAESDVAATLSTQACVVVMGQDFHLK